jgi:L-ascorbate metabolism protein UlaG (beta-lactamase superfamily)
MKIITAILLMLSYTFWTPHSAGAAEAKGDAEFPQEKVILKWIGNAGWEIQLGKIIILIDPFLTRKEPTDREWKTDEEAVLKVIRGADYIFAGHSHADHVGDIPFIAKRFGSKIIGSRTTTNLALTAGVDKSQVTPISGGEKLDFKEFSVQIIESQRGILTIRGKTRQPKFEEISRPWGGPIMGKDFVEGGSYLYYFTFGKHQVLHQSTGNFIEGKLKGLRPDVALFPAHPYDLASVLQTLNPKVIIGHHFDHHFDGQRAPFPEGIPESNVGRARRFARDVQAVDSQIKVIVPQLLMTYALE